MDTPYYLKPVMADAQGSSVMDIGEATKFKYDYDYGYLPEPQEAKTMWEEIAQTTSTAANNAGDMVWSTARGTWESVKAGAVEAINEVRDVGESLTASATGIFDSILMRVLIIFAVLFGAFYLVIKAGALKDVASILL